MSSVTSATDAVVGQEPTQADANNALRQLDMDEFLELLIVELQNQDPLDPMENNEILQQIGQIREIESNTRLTETLDEILEGNNRLTDTLDAMMLGQDATLQGSSLARAAQMIGQHVKGNVTTTDQSGEEIVTEVSGVVDRVSIDESGPHLHVGQHTIDLDAVVEIRSAGQTGEADDAATDQSANVETNQ